MVDLGFRVYGVLNMLPNAVLSDPQLKKEQLMAKLCEVLHLVDDVIGVSHSNRIGCNASKVCESSAAQEGWY